MLRQQTEILSLVFFVDFCTAISMPYCDSYHIISLVYVDSFNNPQKRECEINPPDLSPDPPYLSFSNELNTISFWSHFPTVKVQLTLPEAT